MIPETHGRRVRELFAGCNNTATIISPYIKTEAFRYLVDGIPARCRLKCVTRWLPKDVAAGVSDLGVLTLVEARGNGELYLVDKLHAKLYIADRKCLVGSTNVTLAGLGEIGDSNIEVLVESTVDDPGVVATLSEIQTVERLATRETADALERMIEALREVPETAKKEGWVPRGFRAPDAYRIYSERPGGYLTTADRILLADTAAAGCRPGLTRTEFNEEIRVRLSEIPLLKEFLGRDDDRVLRCVDVYHELEGYTNEEYSVGTLWRALVNWTTHFFPDSVVRQDVSEVTLRRAQVARVGGRL